MKKQWRPEGWIQGGGLQDEVNGEYKDNYFTDTYELGADALLKSLIENGQRLNIDDLYVPSKQRVKGILIFIPDAGEE